jgi:diadenosine tetraphosphate (Ap4A) HIT family hydrolase
MFISEECVFCQIAQKEKKVEVIARFNHCFVIKDQYPVSPGHLLIIPYQHTESWFSSSTEVKEEIVDVLDKIKQLLDIEYHPDGYNIGMNCGKAAGQTVMHLHVHLIPRFKDDMNDPRGGVRGVIPSKQKY